MYFMNLGYHSCFLLDCHLSKIVINHVFNYTLLTCIDIFCWLTVTYLSMLNGIFLWNQFYSKKNKKNILRPFHPVDDPPFNPCNNALCVFRAEASLQSGLRKWPGRAGGRRWWWRAGEELHPPEPCASRGRSRRHCGHLRSQHAQLHRLTWVPQCTALREHGAGQDEAGDQQVAFIVTLYSCRTSVFAVRCFWCELFIAFVPKLNVSDTRLLEQLLEKEREYQTILQQVLEEREQEIRLLRLRSEPAGLYFHLVSLCTPSARKQHHLCCVFNSCSHFTNSSINGEIEAQE